MEITLSLRGQELKILGKQPNLYSGSIGVLYIKFSDVNFDTSLVKAVRFKTEESDWYTQEIIDGRVRVPHEVIVDGGFDVAVGGYDIDDGELMRFLPTNSVHIDVTENGYGEPDAPLAVEGGFESIIGQMDKKADISFVDKLIPKANVAGKTLNIRDFAEGVPLVNYRIFPDISDKTACPVGNIVSDRESENYGKYAVALRLRGKNLFNDKNVVIIPGYFTRTVKTIKEHKNARTIAIPCAPNKTYTISRNTEFTNFHIAYTDELPMVGVDVHNAVTADTVTQNYLTVTTGDNAKYLVAYLYNGYNVEGGENGWEKIIQGIQIELGENSSYYEQYSEKLYYIYLENPLRAAGEQFDEIDFKGQCVLRRIGKDNTVQEEIVEKIKLPQIITLNCGFMNIDSPDNTDANIQLTYYQDINKVIANLKSAHSA